MKMEFNWNKSAKALAYEKTGGGKGRLRLAQDAKRLMDPYVPASQAEMLSQNVRVYTDGDQGVVEYNSPYAHYQYEGEVYGPNYPIKDQGIIVGWYSPPHKTPTGKKLKYSDFPHPLATSHWDKAMMTARKGDLTKAYQKYLGGRR